MTASCDERPSPPVGPDQRFPKKLRVRTRGEFDRVFAEGRGARSEIGLLVCRANALPHSRFAVSVGRKFGDAVRRNRARRLAREAFRLDRSSWPQGYDYVLVPHRPGFPNALEHVRGRLLELARRAARRFETDGPRRPPPPRPKGRR